MSDLNKLILNNFIVKNRHSVRKGKVHVINRIVRRSKQLRQQKANNDKAKEKNIRKADRLIQELMILRKFHADDLTKFALMNRKSLTEVTDDVNAEIEERALCRVANWKTVVPEIDKFREQYPDWEEKVPQLLKSIGLQYRKKRLHRLEKKGIKDKFLEKEHHNITVLQKLTHIDVDPRLLAKARDLMHISKKDGSSSPVKPDRKKQNDSKHRLEKPSVESQDAHDEEVSRSEGSVDHVSKQEKREKKASKKEPKIKKQSEKSVDKCGSGIQKNVEESISDKTSGIEQEESDPEEASASDEESDVGDSPVRTQEKRSKKLPKTSQRFKEQDTESEDEGISEDESFGDKSVLDTPEIPGSDTLETKQVMDEENEESDEEENSSGGESDEDDDDSNLKVGLSKNTLYKEQNENSEDDISSGENMSADEASETDVSDDESEDDEASIEKHHEKDGEASLLKTQMSEKSLLQKKKEKSKVKEKRDEHTSSEKKKKKKSIQDVPPVSDEDRDLMSDDEGSVDFDSEGSIIDENYVPEEITSIWDDFKKKGDKGKSKASDSKSKLGIEDTSGSGNKVIKSKGTVEVRRLDLTDQKSVDALFEGTSGKVASDSDDDDFFVREPNTKKRKKAKQNDNDNSEKASSDSDDGEEANDDVQYSDEETSTRERYLDKNFKRIWGRGMEETIQVSRGRRGVFVRGGGGGRGRGFDGNRGRGFDGDRRGRGFRGGGVENANFLPLGSNFPPEQGHGDSNDMPVSSGWRNNQSSERNFGSPNRGGFKSRGGDFMGNKFRSGRGGEDDLKPGWKRGRFEKRDPNNPNMAPVSGSWNNNTTQRPGSGSWKDNATSSNYDDAKNSLLHPSWLAKQKQREMASSIHNFKGQVKKFDFDD